MIILAFLVVAGSCALMIPVMLYVFQLHSKGWTWQYAALFGSMLASTDAVAIIATMKSSKLLPALLPRHPKKPIHCNPATAQVVPWHDHFCSCGAQSVSLVFACCKMLDQTSVSLPYIRHQGDAYGAMQQCSRLLEQLTFVSISAPSFQQ